MTQNAWNADLLTTNGQTYIGNTGGQITAATLTAGTNVTVTNSAGGISIATAAHTDWEKINATTASSDSSIEWTCPLTDWQAVVLIGNNTQQSTTAGAGVRVSTDGGSTFLTSTYHTTGWEIDGSGGEAGLSGTGANKLQSWGSNTETAGADANEVCSFYQIIWQPSNTEYTKALSYCYYNADNGDNIFQAWYMIHLSTTAVNALGYFPSSGNIAQGEFILYGIQK